jgi:hypothetical protein
MKKITFNSITVLGLVCVSAWIADAVNVIYFLHTPASLLWYSSTALLFTGVSLIIQNKKMLSIAFCAFFILESMWTISFLTGILFHKPLLGITDYMFDPSYAKRNFYTSMYHILISPSLLVAVLKIKPYYKWAWIWSMGIAAFLAVLTLFLVDPNEQINCIHMIRPCKVFGFFNSIPDPFRVILGILLATLFAYIPSNYLLKFLKNIQYYGPKTKRGVSNFT